MKSKVFAINEEIEIVEVDTIEGKTVQGTSWVKPLLQGENGLLIEVNLKKGTITPSHEHNHESYAYILKGEVRMTIGDETRELGAGDSFLHPKGVQHVSEVLEDAVWVEVKTPPEIVW